ncbi:TPA: hypothetical protein QCP98_005339 [Bacillus cereus]|nr:hypothetical protein [Bacillus cereus]HDR4464449.1 hypothetical protein [Bacillus cereus]
MYYYEQNLNYGLATPDYEFQHFKNLVEHNPLSNWTYPQLNNNHEFLGITDLQSRNIVGSHPGTKGFENLLTKYSYEKPYSTKCKIKGPFGSWTWGPCIKTETVVTGVYFGFNYPDRVTHEQEIAILHCGKIASEQGYAIIAAGFKAGGPPGALAAVPPANSTAREVLKKCLENSGLTTYIVKHTHGGIYTKRLS